MLGTDESIAIMKLLRVQGIGPAKVNALIDWCRKSDKKISEVIKQPDVLSSRFTKDQIASIESDNCLAEDELVRANARLISAYDPEYPNLLQDGMKGKSPPILYCRGNVQLLSEPAVGFCGSRKASQKGIETAQDCAEQLAQQGFVIVSGYAAGVDISTHVSALAAGGTTIVVLPEGIMHFRVKQEVKEFWDWERVVVVSQFEPKVPWSVHNAMTRNSVICGISKAMILIEAGTTGGSIAAGRTCLEMGRPLFAPVYEGLPETAAGNRILLKEGAHPVGKSRLTNRAAIERICEVIGNSGVSNDGSQQISLFA